jgi:hypothetical protein
MQVTTVTVSATGNLLMSASPAVFIINILFYKLLDDE